MPTPVTRTPLFGSRTRKGARAALAVAATATLLPIGPALAAVVAPPSPAFTQTSAQTVNSGFMAQVADMNEDGKLDIVSSQLTGPQGFTIELGKGDGTFSAPVATAVAKQHGVSVGDVNGDGHQDVVTRSNANGSIQVFFGTGTGTVTAGTPQTIPTQSNGANANGVYTPTLLRDFDNDGKLDLAVPIYQGTVTGYFTILKGDGLGGFANTNTNFNISQAYGLGAADLNGDGYADLVAADDYLRQVTVYLSDGTGGFHFQAPVTMPYTASSVTALAVGDLNHDGKPDFATANSVGLTEYLNNGSGAFTASTVAAGSRSNVAIADFNGDGYADLASENNSTSKEEIFLGSAAGTFTLASASYSVGTSAYTARSADFNGDGHPDLQVSSYGTNLSRVLTYTGLVGAPVVTTNPTSSSVTVGQTATFTAAASGSPTVQWQRSTDSGVTWNDVTGAVSTTYTTPATTASDTGSRFRAVFTNTIGTATTTAATLTVLTAPAVMAQPTDQSVNAGDTATFTATASGNPAPALQWQRSTDKGATFTNLAGQTSDTLTFPAASGDDGNQYRMVATNSTGSATSNAATLTVVTAPQVTGQPVDQTVASGQNATFTATASGSASTVQWQDRADATSAWADLAGQTSGTLTFATSYADSGRQYRAVFTNGAGSAISSPATLTVSAAAPAVTSQPVDQSVQSGQPAMFSAAGSGDPAPTVQWQRSTDGGATFTDLPGETSTTLALTASYADNGSGYRAVFTNPGGTATTSAATLTVSPTSPTVTGQPADQSVASGQSATFTAASTGDPTPAVQWQRSTDGATFTDLPGETSTTLTFTAGVGDDQSSYRAVFSNLGGSATTSVATLTVTDAPRVTGQPQDTTVNEGSTATFKSTASGTPTPTVQWQVSTDNGQTFTDVPGATTTTFTTEPVASTDTGNQYRAVFTNSTGTATSDSAAMTVVVPAGPVQSPPSAPRNVKATQTGPGQMTITWDAPAEPGSSAVIGYDVGYGNGGSGNGITVPASTHKAVFDGLSNGSYQASVAASNAAGAGPRVFVAITVKSTAAVTPPVVGQLPRTGRSIEAQVAWALGTVAVGIGLLLLALRLARRKRITA